MDKIKGKGALELSTALLFRRVMNAQHACEVAELIYQVMCAEFE